MTERWEFWIDRGGTFTDCIGRNPHTGELLVEKVLSTDRAPLDGVRKILGIGAHDPIPPCDIRMGTTVATNALLERRGAPCALVTTRGFGDLLDIGTQARPNIFELEIEKPSLVYRHVLELDTRAEASGALVTRHDPAQTLLALEELLENGIESLAVVILHAYRSAQLELEIGELARQVGFRHVSLSHAVAGEIGMVGRGDTTTVDAYLTPLIRDYVRGLERELRGSSLRLMQSSGGLSDARRFRGPQAILSGPAGGTVACAAIARTAGYSSAIGFDMGGTSTDVSRYAGDFERVYETQTAGVRLRAPMLHIHTVAAGGGSICRFDGRRFTVGPESAGAVPGPVCYGHQTAREPTVTDVNLVLGRLQADRFPFPLDLERARRALDGMAAELARAGDARGIDSIAEGLFEIANSNMAEAIRRVSISRGHDVREDALVVFGGAGAQHACAIAAKLGIRKILFHPLGGVLSAYGMGLADVTHDGQADGGRLLLHEGAMEKLEREFKALEQNGNDVLRGEGFTDDRIELIRRVDLRYRGTETALTLETARNDELRDRFDESHEKTFGYARREHPVEVEQIRVEAIGRHRPSPAPTARETNANRTEPTAHRRVFFSGGFRERVPVFRREDLTQSTTLEGPVLVLDPTATIVIDPGYRVSIGEHDVLIATETETATRANAYQPASSAADPVLLEVMANSYMSIAEQMGVVLRQTAMSTNIRERLDFSCAVFDSGGGLVANAPHIPVHLGAMGESVRGVLEAHPNPAPGDVFVTNDPAEGGSHLPDITVVTPVHDDDDRLLFFTASRGHHADIGGITPGSMPPFSRTLHEEGVVLRAPRIVTGGELDREGVLDLLRSGPYPARAPLENLADLEAQIAANRTGTRLLSELVERHGLDVVTEYMLHVQDNAAASVAAQIALLDDGENTFEDWLDDGTLIRVRTQVNGERMKIDFSGTSPMVETNLNAPRAVTVAAVIYVLRCLVGTPIPLNSGCLRPVELLIPEGSLLHPAPECAVVAGNVETSQRVVDVLLGALGRAAASQGTMNNVTFGNERFGYYETIAGGAGATPKRAGASAVHTHMTNTRITDPEVLESRYPVRLIQFSIRRGSGGGGRFPGGDGVTREIEFLEPMRLSILSERRERAPFGLAGGGAGALGVNRLNGRTLPGKASVDVTAGDVLRIDTPGGGGFGSS